ncbi:lipase family protein [Pseudolysobacter antarcticus]|uniref:Lipase family protein n=1 Tax=Pseudolysobacter antarcticus TaxID=2511995 RepID=A0A411HHZ4_9GAMM|nr:lipase family protein [Pseudolysobacter antarcticus]QBB70139.1 lipase family protein [Pseudolysobacter antarcticus]
MTRINDEQAAQFALLAMYAEDMLDPNLQVLNPPPDARMGGGWNLVGYLTGLDAVFGGQKIGLGQRLYYGFLASSVSHPTNYIAVVRGTEKIVEWIENLDAVLVDGPLVGKVEQGFYSIYESMQYLSTKVTAAQGIASALPDGSTITVVGHSLGAAIGTYLMEDLARIGNGKFTVFGSLFASPRPGDADYAKAVDTLVGTANYMVYNYSRDIVPHIPLTVPLLFGFQALPSSTWITSSTAQAQIKFDIFCNHHAYCYAAMLDFTTTRGVNLASIPCVLGKN